MTPAQIPDHPAEHDALAPNPNKRCPGWQFMELPIDPSKVRERGGSERLVTICLSQGTAVTDTRLGTVGLAVTGGAFFNDLSNPDGSLALTNEGTSLDSCLGHSAPTGGAGGGGPPGGGPPGGGPPGGGPPGGGPPGGRSKRQTETDTPHSGTYHYHGNINCTNAGAATGATDPSKCVLLGYYNDGVPVYGLCRDSAGAVFTSCYEVSSSATLTDVVTVSGTYSVAASNSDYTFSAGSDCNLDEASGAVHPSTGQYSYFMTTGYPWTPIKWAGDQGTASLCSAA